VLYASIYDNIGIDRIQFVTVSLFLSLRFLMQENKAWFITFALTMCQDADYDAVIPTI